MNWFTEHAWGPYADDGFGNLRKLTRKEQYIVAFVSLMEYDE